MQNHPNKTNYWCKLLISYQNRFLPKHILQQEIQRYYLHLFHLSNPTKDIFKNPTLNPWLIIRLGPSLQEYGYLVLRRPSRPKSWRKTANKISRMMFVCQKRIGMSWRNVQPEKFPRIFLLFFRHLKEVGWNSSGQVFKTICRFQHEREATGFSS